MQQYNILQATKTGEPFQLHGKDMQSWFLKVEGIDMTVLCTRLVTSPQLSGATWGELEPATSKVGKAYKKFRVKKPLDGGSATPLNRQTALPLAPAANDELSWQSALLAASKFSKTAEETIANARILFAAKPVVETPEEPPIESREPQYDPQGTQGTQGTQGAVIQAAPGDVAPEFVPSEINLDDIPF